MGFRQRIINKQMEGFSDKEKSFFRKLGVNIHFIFWSIAKTMVMIWLFMKAYDRVGFEKVVIIQLVIIGIVLRDVLYKENLKEKYGEK